MAHFDENMNDDLTCFNKHGATAIRNETVVLNSKSRKTYQHIELMNDDNVYRGTFEGVMRITSSDILSSYIFKSRLEMSELSNCVIYDKDGVEIYQWKTWLQNLSGWTESKFRMTDNDIGIISCDLSSLSVSTDERFSNLTQGVQDQGSNTVEAMNAMSSYLKSDYCQRIGNLEHDAFSCVSSVSTDIVQSLNETYSDMIDTVRSVSSNIADTMSDVSSCINAEITQVSSDIVDIVTDVSSNAVDLVGRVSSDISGRILEISSESYRERKYISGQVDELSSDYVDTRKSLSDMWYSHRNLSVSNISIDDNLQVLTISSDGQFLASCDIRSLYLDGIPLSIDLCSNSTTSSNYLLLTYSIQNPTNDGMTERSISVELSSLMNYGEIQLIRDQIGELGGELESLVEKHDKDVEDSKKQFHDRFRSQISSIPELSSGKITEDSDIDVLISATVKLFNFLASEYK